MVSRDRYEAIMNEFVTRMEEAAATFDKEMREHADALADLLNQSEDSPAGIANAVAKNQAEPVASGQTKTTPPQGRGGARLFD